MNEKSYRLQLKDLLMVFISGLELSDRNTRCLPSAQLAVDWIMGEAGEMDDQVDKNKMVVAKNLFKRYNFCHLTYSENQRRHRKSGVGRKLAQRNHEGQRGDGQGKVPHQGKSLVSRTYTGKNFLTFGHEIIKQ